MEFGLHTVGTQQPNQPLGADSLEPVGYQLWLDGGCRDL